MSPQLRRATDQADAEGHDSYMRVSAVIAFAVGAAMPIVTVLGESFVWVHGIYRAMRGLEAVDLPSPPWPVWMAALWFVVFSLVGAAFWRNQIGQPGRVLDLVLGLLPRRGDGEKVTAEARVTVEADDGEDE